MMIRQYLSDKIQPVTGPVCLGSDARLEDVSSRTRSFCRRWAQLRGVYSRCIIHIAHHNVGCLFTWWLDRYLNKSSLLLRPFERVDTIDDQIQECRLNVVVSNVDHSVTFNFPVDLLLGKP